MSDMEMFYGKVIRSDRTDVPEITDDDEYYEWEELQGGRTYHIVNGDLFEVTAKESGIDIHGGTLHIPPSDTKEHRFLCYWYNGGAGQREVIESAIVDLLGYGL